MVIGSRIGPCHGSQTRISPPAPAGPAPARTCARWGSTSEIGASRWSGSRRPGRGRCRATSNQRAARGTGRRRRARRRRDTARVQHDRDLRQPHAGHTRYARLPRQPRADRRLGRARRPQPALRRARLHRRLRQDDSRARDGPAAARRPGADPLLGRDGGGVAPRSARDDPGRVGGSRSPRERPDRRRRPWRSSNAMPVPATAPARGTSPPTRWPSRSTSSGSARSGSAAFRRRTRRKGDAAEAAGVLVLELIARDVRPSALVTRALARERDRRDHRHRRLDQRGAPPARDRERGRRRAHPRGFRPPLRHHAGRDQPDPRRPLRRGRPPPRRWDRGGRQAAPPPPLLRRSDSRREDTRRARRRRERARRRGDRAPPPPRSSRAARCACCTETSPRRAPS